VETHQENSSKPRSDDADARNWDAHPLQAVRSRSRDQRCDAKNDGLSSNG
jgi:hypothetical protein